MKTYLHAIDSAIIWINAHMLTSDNGYNGIYERIRIDVNQRTDWTRPDCNAEYVRVLCAYEEMTGDRRHAPLAENLLGWLERTQDTMEGSAWKGSLPFFLIDGCIREEKVGQTIYQNDNGKVMNAMCQIYALRGDARALMIAKGVAEYWIHTQQSDGTYGVQDGRNMHQCRKGPCFVQWLASGFYMLYGITGENRYLQSAERGMEYLLSLLHPGGRCATSFEILRMEDWRPVSSETSMMLYTLARAYATTRKPRYEEKLHHVAKYLLSLQHESGAILNCTQDCLDASLQNNPDLCDLVYTQGFALHALIMAFDATRERRYLDAAFMLGDFLESIQCRGESALWDGGWRGSYNVVTREWDGRANQNNAIDEGGMYSVYTGWCCTNIVYGLILLEGRRSMR